MCICWSQILNLYLLPPLPFFFYLYINFLATVCKPCEDRAFCLFCSLLYFQFSHSVVSDSVTPWTAACQASLSITNSRSLLKFMSISRWCHLTVSSSVIPFSSCLQSFPASESFPMSWSFASGGQSIGASASALVLPINKKLSVPKFQ